MEEKINSKENHLKEDILFHEILAKLSRNEVISKLIPVIQSFVLLFIMVTDAVLKEETMLTHRAIVNAIENHDPDSAQEAMVAHLLAKKIFPFFRH